MNYLTLFFSNKRLLTFGILLTFFSGLGKTFMFGLYLPYFLKSFQISPTIFGFYYALVTLISGISLIFLGRLIDNADLKKYTTWVILGLVVATLIVYASNSLPFLLIGILGMRLTGQGLLNHTSLTAITKYFKFCRGKAISIILLGHPLGEAIWPIITFALINAFGWRNSLLFNVGVLLICFIPSVYILIRKKIKPSEIKSTTYVKPKKKLAKAIWTYRKIIRNRKFYFLAPPMLIQALLTTALFFYMVPIAEAKNWSHASITLCYAAIALGSSSSGIFTGLLVDRFKPSRLFPFYNLPLAVGLLIMPLIDKPWVIILYLFFAGISIGAGFCVESSTLAEMYGVRSLGTVRSAYATIMIFATALGPVMFGLILEAGKDFNFIFIVSAVAIIICCLVSLIGIFKYRPIRTIKRKFNFELQRG